jgi:hypothetical protein
MDIPAVECSARYGIDRGTGRSKKICARFSLRRRLNDAVEQPSRND